MRLLVDSGSTKADWIAIDEDGKVLFTTQTLGLNPEILEGDEIIVIFFKIKTKPHTFSFMEQVAERIK
jgi:N-methylhydantoinase A/oxoprolinase/acetone carboxylase beta subunit